MALRLPAVDGERASLFDAYPDCDPDRYVLVLLTYDDQRIASDIRAEIIAGLSPDLPARLTEEDNLPNIRTRRS